MKQKIKQLVLCLSFLGFSFVCFHSGYSLEYAASKVIILATSCILLIVGMTSLKVKETITADVDVDDIEQFEINTFLIEIFAPVENKALYFSKRGSTEHKTGNYKAAISYYIEALKNGADEETMDDNIWQAFKDVFKEENNDEYVKKYFDLMPMGAYHSEAKAVLMGHYI